MDKTGHVILPGLINTHNHVPMVYFRGLADDMPLKKWLDEYIWPMEKKFLSPEFVYDATKLSCAEMLSGGITTFADMYYFEGSVARATKEMLMRGVLGPTILGFPGPVANTLAEYMDDAEKYICEWIYDELITPTVCPHSPYACEIEHLQKSRELANKYDIPMHIHIAESKWEEETILAKYGKRPIEHLESLGFFDAKIIAAHCVQVNEIEIEKLAKYNVGVSHCINSNLKMAVGIAPVLKMLRAGVNVSIGTDSASSNNRQDLFSEISAIAKVHKYAEGDPTVLDAKTVMYMATRGGAKVLGMDDKIGSLRPGHLADVIAVDFHKLHLTPLYDVYSHLVYAAKSSDVATAIINGKIVLDNRKLVFANEGDIIAKALEWQQKIKLDK